MDSQMNGKENTKRTTSRASNAVVDLARTTGQSPGDGSNGYSPQENSAVLLQPSRSSPAHHLPTEQWRVIPSHPKYEVSNLGRVRRAVPGQNTRIGRLLKPTKLPGGYLVVPMPVNGTAKPAYIHRLVAEAFIQAHLDGYKVVHVDGNKTNNVVGNLQVIPYCKKKSYTKKRRSPVRRGNCVVFGCQHPVYAKGFCHNHYAQVLRSYQPLPEIILRCHVPSCIRTFKLNRRKDANLCPKHASLKQSREEAGLPTDVDSLEKNMVPRGEKHHWWNGGTSEYPNSYVFEKNGRIALQRANYLCPCGAKAQHVHHINHNKSDHRVENLLPMCAKCHSRHHWEAKKKKEAGKPLQNT